MCNQDSKILDEKLAFCYGVNHYPVSLALVQLATIMKSALKVLGDHVIKLSMIRLYH